MTDSRGNFLLSMDASAAGEVNAEIAVHGPARSGAPSVEYRVYDLTFRTLDVAGDAHVLPPWSTPSQPDLARLVRVFTPVGSASVEFRRTGGIRTTPEIYRTATDDQGICELFHFLVSAVDAGDVVGDLYLDGVLELRGLRIRFTPEFRPEVGLRTIDVSAPGSTRP